MSTLVRVTVVITSDLANACEREAFRLYERGASIVPVLSEGVRSVMRTGAGEPVRVLYPCSVCETRSGAPWCFRCKRAIDAGGE